MSSDAKETVAPTADELKAKAEAEKSRQAADELTKYKSAAEIVNNAIKKLVELSVEGAKILELCEEGDKLIEAGTSAVYNSKTAKGKVTKGLAFPTSISVNNCVSHYSPVPTDPLANTTLAKGDVVKIHVGAHIDGFASVSAETLIVGATEAEPATGRAADVVKAAWHCAEVAMRLVKPGEKNWAVTDAMNKVAAAWGCKPVEGMLSCQQTQNVIDGKKRIILNPTPELKSGLDTATFAEGEVWGIDILVASSDDGKVKPQDSRTTIYQRATDVTYQLKLKAAREAFSDIQKKAGPFPFTIQAVQHGLLRPYDVVYTPAGSHVAAFHFTIALLPGGPSLISAPPVWYKAEKLKTEKELEDEELKSLVGKKLRDPKKKKKKAAGGDGEAKEDAE
ncbi:Curved DNA-binding protein OS=Schizosaccharomyces pombe (strain 972 / ATCC 24843) GN=cdb4 PE=1 SV=1 [Rhizoctonia solani AG-1 IB]|uniref:Curved DNA-binding protein n=2 Tax=Thanatephorus cucumeris (strain AG1-IB / isolate 7/3/14) TaxID=1108050 RepID=A0A0B7FE99_THACB|nr:Curved DNA-binding protein OS=Schizosaccharomyces pombe (strain 972 / ATCC 24843) GN=cdb4 PE=1 SV=1 [Rhizoctonia solani AG-1 IB]